MSKIIDIFLISMIFFCLITLGNVLVKNINTKEDKLRIVLEMAYFEGQRNALENDVRIKQNDKGCWEWSKSPWDEGNRMPTYNPKNCEYNELP